MGEREGKREEAERKPSLEASRLEIGGGVARFGYTPRLKRTAGIVLFLSLPSLSPRPTVSVSSVRWRVSAKCRNKGNLRVHRVLTIETTGRG